MLASDIKPAPYNPRVITEDEQLALSHSISRFGDISGITWNRRTGFLVTGHQRWQELKGKYKEIKLAPIDDKTYGIVGDEQYTSFRVRVVDWDEQTERLANITANAHTISGKYDLDMLPAIMEDLDLTDKTELRLDVLEKELKIDMSAWSSDIEPAGEPNLDGILGTIKVSCEQEQKDVIRDKIKDALSGIDGVTIA